MAITQRAPKTVLTQSIVRNKRFYVHVFERASIIGMLCVLPPEASRRRGLPRSRKSVETGISA